MSESYIASSRSRARRPAMMCPRGPAPDEGWGSSMETLAALEFLWWLVIVFFWIMFLALTMTIARSKGHSPLLWGILAIFFPLITVIIVLALPNRSTV